MNRFPHFNKKINVYLFAGAGVVYMQSTSLELQTLYEQVTF